VRVHSELFALTQALINIELERKLARLHCQPRPSDQRHILRSRRLIRRSADGPDSLDFAHQPNEPVEIQALVDSKKAMVRTALQLTSRTSPANGPHIGMKG
jgi:hypothetical protein